jgi:predicted nucleotidyltransferase
LLKALSDRPDIAQLERFLERVLEQRGEELAFIVLFGSMARGDWSPGSDYDVVVGLRGEDGKRFIDRIGEFQALVDGEIDVLPYSRAEWERMVADRALVFLEAFADGIVLWDRGSFEDLRREFEQWQANGQVTRFAGGWQRSPERGST